MTNPLNMSATMIAVAPNGAQHSKLDHPKLPITPHELAHTAASCLEAGATMIHLHVRDEKAKHSLAPEHYRPAIQAIKSAVGHSMLIQVTSEAAGVYTTDEQIRLITELEPEGISIALKEFFIKESDIESSAHFLSRLNASGTLIQYILYSPDDVRRYTQFIRDGIIPNSKHTVLFVLGRYSSADATQDNLKAYIAALSRPIPWMVCAFGPNALKVLVQAASLGGHIRIGFENGWALSETVIADNNAMLVQEASSRVKLLNRQISNIEYSKKLFN